MFWEWYSKTDGYSPIFHTNKIPVLLKNWGKSFSQGKRTQPLPRGGHVSQSWLASCKRNGPGATRKGFPSHKKGEVFEEKFSALHWLLFPALKGHSSRSCCSHLTTRRKRPRQHWVIVRSCTRSGFWPPTQLCLCIICLFFVSFFFFNIYLFIFGWVGS